MDTSIRHRDYLVVGLVLLIALGLRFWQLGGKSLWVDECASWALARVPLAEMAANTTEKNPPLYYGLLHAWMRFAGTSETALRSLSVVFGIVAVVLCGWIGRLIGGRSLGILAMALMAVMPMPLEFSQTARGYTLFVSGALASFGCLLMWERDQSRRWAAGYVLTTLLMCYTHYYWVFVVLAQQLYIGWAILQRRVSWRTWSVLSGLVLLGYSPWLMVQLSEAADVLGSGKFWIPRPSLSSFMETIRGYVTFGAHPLLIWAYFLVITFGFFEIRPLGSSSSSRGHWIAAMHLRRWEVRLPCRRSDVLLLIWLGCSLVVPFVWSRIQAPIFYPRYTIAAAPAFYLLLGRGILAFPGRMIRNAVLAGIIAAAAWGLPYYYAWEEEDWRGLVSSVEASLKPSDTLVVANHDTERAVRYYLTRTAPLRLLEETAEDPNRTGPAQQAIGTTGARDRTWFIIRATEADRREALDIFATQHAGAAAVHQWRFRGELFVYLFGLAPSHGKSAGAIPHG